MLEDQTKGMSLKEVNKRCEVIITIEAVEAEFGRFIEYDLKIMAILSWMKSENREQAK